MKADRISQAIDIVHARHLKGVTIPDAVSEATFRLDLTREEREELERHVETAQRVNERSRVR